MPNGITNLSTKSKENIMNWDAAKQKIYDHQQSGYAWVSEKRSLLYVFEAAERWGLSPVDACAAGLSNLRFAIVEMKRTVRWEQPEELKKILHYCATLPTVQLRLTLHIPELDEVQVEQVGDHFIIDASPAQYMRIKKSTALQHKFSVRLLAAAPLSHEYATREDYNDVQ
jgi:hypothetical protein